MQLRKDQHELSVLEAFDHLSYMAELDNLPSKEESIPNKALSETQAASRMHALSWRDPEYYPFHQEKVKETFQTILKYMKELYEKGKGHLREEQIQQGMQAVMTLAAEAAKKIDDNTEIFKGAKGDTSVTELKEFKELQHFYLTKIVQRYQKTMETEEKWLEHFGKEGAQETKQEALKDIETVRKDKEYELFFIRKENGTAYFSRSLLRHLQLIRYCDALLTDPSMEDPFLRIQMILDREAHHAAKEILKLASPYVDHFFKQALKFKKVGFVQAIAKALMALMLASNSRNLIQNSIGKYALNYYRDFHHYLRSALKEPEYLKLIQGSIAQSSDFLHSVMNLSHVLCTSFFLKIGSCKEMMAFIHGLIAKVSELGGMHKEGKSPLAFWNHLHEADQQIRSLLKRYPSGPLLKTIKLFEEGDQMQGFDPIAKQIQVGQLYTMIAEGIHVSILRLPSPTAQGTIVKASVIEEFKAFLLALGEPNKNQRHLMINLQDRSSWSEHARCIALEQMQDFKQFKNTFRVVTLAKNTDFYWQTGSYIEWDDAQEFMKELKGQLKTGEQCGFFFPSGIDKKFLFAFVDEAIGTIHTVFFAGKERLLHKNRLDFIEIFYWMLTLKLIEEFHPDTLSFTCKDGVDIAAAENGGMFAFLRMMNDPSSFSKEEKDFLLWMFYAPALIIRERAIDSDLFHRTLSALSIVQAELEAHLKKTVSSCSKLYTLPFFSALKVGKL